MKLSISLSLRVSLIYGMCLFSGSVSKASMAYAVLTPLTTCDEAVAHAGGIILVLMSWAVWFACVGIKLYKRHLCQKDGQHLRRLLKTKDTVICESSYNVSCQLWQTVCTNVSSLYSFRVQYETVLLLPETKYFYAY